MENQSPFPTSHFIKSTSILRWTCFDSKLSEYSCYEVLFKMNHLLKSSFLNSRFLFCSFDECHFDYMKFENCFFEEAIFKNSVLRNAQFINCTFINCKFEIRQDGFDSIENVFFQRCYFNNAALEQIVKTATKQIFIECLFRQGPLPTHLIDNCEYLVHGAQTQEPKSEEPKTPVKSAALVQIPGRFNQLEV